MERSLCLYLCRVFVKIRFQVFEFPVEQCESDCVEFEIFDEDPGKDDFIGRLVEWIPTESNIGLVLLLELKSQSVPWWATDRLKHG